MEKPTVLLEMKSETLLSLTLAQLTLTMILAVSFGGFVVSVSSILAFILAILALLVKLREEYAVRCKRCAGSGFLVNSQFLTEVCDCQHETKI